MVKKDVAPCAAPTDTKQRIGRYRLIQTLGRGGMGTIYLALVSGLGGFRKLVVLKVLRPELALDDKFVELFMREATLAAFLNHPNVVHTVEASHEDDQYFLVMEFLDGQPFSELIHRARRDPVVPLALRLQVICHALTGLHYAHELRDYDGRALHMVHRDVSPTNLFVTYDGQVKLLDFGIARARDADCTRPGEFKGKIGYAAPEQLRQLPVDRRVDVFAAGVVLWEAIALRQLARGRTPRETFEARLAGTEPRIGQIVEDVDPWLAAICDRAMAPDPEHRYPSAEAFRQDLQSYLVQSGEALDATAIGEFMCSKFASARASMHQLIDAQLREEERTSVTTVGRPRLRTPEPADATLAPAPAEEPPQRGLPTRWLAPAGALAALAAIGLLWSLRSSREMLSATAIPPTSEPRAPVAEPRAPVAEPRAVPVVQPLAPPRPTPAAEVDAGALPQSVRPRRAATSVPVERPRRSTAEPSHHEAERTNKPASAARSARTEAKGQADAATELDLRAVPKRERRRLDVDSPFR